MLCLVFFPLTAHAAPFACAGLAGIEEKTLTCEDNNNYGQSGIDCLKALEKAIQARAAAAKAQLAASNLRAQQAGNAQTHNFQGANADYGISQDALTELIGSAKAAHASVDSYLNNIIYPEDFDAPEELIGDTVDFLDESPCYNENRVGLEQVKKRIEGHIRELEAANVASVARARLSAFRHVGQDSITQPVVHGQAGKGAGAPVPTGPSRNPASSITGVREDAAKRAQGEPVLR